MDSVTAPITQKPIAFPFPLTPTRCIQMSRIFGVTMPSLKIKCPPPGINSPSSPLFASLLLTPACFSQLTSSFCPASPQQSWQALISRSFCASVPFDPSHQTSQPRSPSLPSLISEALSELYWLSFSPFPVPQLPLSFSWVSAMPMYLLHPSLSCVPARDPASTPGPASFPRQCPWSRMAE